VSFNFEMLLENEEWSKCAMHQQKILFTFFNFILITLILIESEPAHKVKDMSSKMLVFEMLLKNEERSKCECNNIIDSSFFF